MVLKLKEWAEAERSLKGRTAKVPQEVLGLRGFAVHPSGFLLPSEQREVMQGMRKTYQPVAGLEVEEKKGG